jgi:hypothetical protein
MVKKKIWENLQRIVVHFSKIFTLSSQKYGLRIWDLEKLIPDPGSERHRIPDQQHWIVYEVMPY